MQANGRWIGLMAILLAPWVAEGKPHFPRFLTLDRPDARGGIELLWSQILLEDGEANSEGLEVSSRRVDIFVELGVEMPDGSRHGGYFQIAQSSFTVEGAGRSPDGATGLELGYAYVAQRDQYEVVYRIGLAPGASEDAEDLAVNSITFPARLTDLALALPDVGVVRLACSGRGQSGRLFFQLDVGLDAPKFGRNAERAPTLFRLNGGLGVQVEPLEVGLESVNLFFLTESQEFALHTLTFGVRAALGAVRPGFGITLPLDDSLRGAINGALQFSLGVQF